MIIHSIEVEVKQLKSGSCQQVGAFYFDMIHTQKTLTRYLVLNDPRSPPGQILSDQTLESQ